MVILSININAADFKESKMKCDNNIAKGCHSLGYIYYFQMNNKAEGRKAYKKACSLKNKNSCLALGNISHREGKGKEEEKYLQKACDIGSDLGCQLLGNIYLEQKRHQEAKPLLEKGCNSLTLDKKVKQEACRDLREIASNKIDEIGSSNYIHSTVEDGTPVNRTTAISIAKKYYDEKDYPNSIRYNSPLCDNGNGEACAMLGNSYLATGKSKEGEVKLKKSCTLDYYRGCMNLGFSYLGIKKYDKAEKYVLKACLLSDDNLIKLNSCGATGRVFQKYPTLIYKNKARIYYTKACEAGKHTQFNNGAAHLEVCEDSRDPLEGMPKEHNLVDANAGEFFTPDEIKYTLLKMKKDGASSSAILSRAMIMRPSRMGGGGGGGATASDEEEVKTGSGGHYEIQTVYVPGGNGRTAQTPVWVND